MARKLFGRQTPYHSGQSSHSAGRNQKVQPTPQWHTDVTAGSPDAPAPQQKKNKASIFTESGTLKLKGPHKETSGHWPCDD